MHRHFSSPPPLSGGEKKKVRASERSQEATGRIEGERGAWRLRRQGAVQIVGDGRVASMPSAAAQRAIPLPLCAPAAGSRGKKGNTEPRSHPVLRSSAYAARGLACTLTRGALERQQMLHRGAGCGDADAVVRGVLRRAGYALPSRHAWAVACWTQTACECSDARTACRSTAARRHLLPDLRRPEGLDDAC